MMSVMLRSMRPSMLLSVQPSLRPSMWPSKRLGTRLGTRALATTALPRLPLPWLEDTVARYVDSVASLLTPEELERTRVRRWRRTRTSEERGRVLRADWPGGRAAWGACAR